MTDPEPCPFCTEQGRCPRCGQAALDENFEKCLACGWTGDSPGMPEGPDGPCPCEEEAERRADEARLDGDW